MKRTVTTLLAIILLIPSLAAIAQTGFSISNWDRGEFEQHRQNLMDSLGSGVAVLFGEYDRSDYMRWRQNNTFYYFSGVEIPGAVFTIDAQNRHEILFLPPARSGSNAIFDGTTLGPGPEARQYFGVDEVRPVSELESYLQSLERTVTIYLNYYPPEVLATSARSSYYTWEQNRQYGWAEDMVSKQLANLYWVQRVMPNATTSNIFDAVSGLRRKKTNWEIDRIVEACRIAGEGHMAAIKASGPGIKEYVAEAAATHRFVTRGALYPGYNAIVGSGKNTTVLHYGLSSRSMRKGELVLMDYGPDYRYYVSDITRTWPVDRKFTKKHAKAYQELLAVQKELISWLKPGESFASFDDKTEELLTKKGYGNKIYHGVSHYLGMSVHDLGGYREPFEPGVVITVEPGIYFMEQGWGIRIEDVVLITADGAVNLSAMIPKELADIENLRSKSPSGVLETSFNAGPWTYMFKTNLETGVIEKKRRLQ
jgi:Xaa-Pro aminopeptidase